MRVAVKKPKDTAAEEMGRLLQEAFILQYCEHENIIEVQWDHTLLFNFIRRKLTGIAQMVETRNWAISVPNWAILQKIHRLAGFWAIWRFLR